MLKDHFMKNEIKRKIDVCLTPEMLHLFDLKNKNIVIIDVFRATSAMCVFLNNGGECIFPIASLEEANQYKKIIPSSSNFLFAAERNGEVVPGFDYGNSPLLYDKKDFTAVSLLLTTTNGTRTIEKTKDYENNMLIASFLNVSSVVRYLESQVGDVLIVCSGWKGRLCVEDVLLAGLLSHKLSLNKIFKENTDSVFFAKNMYDLSKKDLFQFLLSSSYMRRMDLVDDVRYCLQVDTIDIVPIWQNNTSNEIKSGFFSIKY